MSINNNADCTICLLGGDQLHGWYQKLQVIRPTIPYKDAIRLFELYNRVFGEYDSNHNDVGYIGLDNLADEVCYAREKMRREMVAGLDYGCPEKEFDSSVERYKAMVLAEPERYAGLEKYLEHMEWGLKDVFTRDALAMQTYYWIDYVRIDELGNAEDSFGDFNHWYEVIELYEGTELPFDLSNKDVAGIFGFKKFAAFADLSYGC